MSVNILIVDDSLPMRSVIKKTIKASGYAAANFVEAADGEEAIKALGNDWLDIVITDYNMPNMNGLELIKEMQKNDAFKSVPVVVVTTEGSQSKVEEFISSGASGYIKKPFTPEAIREKLTEILGEMEYDDDFEDSDDGCDF